MLPMSIQFSSLLLIFCTCSAFRSDVPARVDLCWCSFNTMQTFLSNTQVTQTSYAQVQLLNSDNRWCAAAMHGAAPSFYSGRRFHWNLLPQECAVETSLAICSLSWRNCLDLCLVICIVLIRYVCACIYDYLCLSIHWLFGCAKYLAR